jgi:hypothetical protein
MTVLILEANPSDAKASKEVKVKGQYYQAEYHRLFVITALYGEINSYRNGLISSRQYFRHHYSRSELTERRAYKPGQ